MSRRDDIEINILAYDDGDITLREACDRIEALFAPPKDVVEVAAKWLVYHWSSGEEGFDSIELYRQATITSAATELLSAIGYTALAAENERLRERLADWESSVQRALNPYEDEEHCTCVPILRAEVERLREQLRVMERIVDSAEGIAGLGPK